MKRVPATRIEQTVGEFRRVLQTEPGFDDRGGKYGVHVMDLRFALVGELGAVHFLMATGWVPGRRMDYPSASHYPCGSNIGFHWKTKPYEGHDFHDDECDWLAGGCFYDASYSAADPAAERFVAEGMDAVWSDLERHYREFASEVAKS